MLIYHIICASWAGTAALHITPPIHARWRSIYPADSSPLTRSGQITYDRCNKSYSPFSNFFQHCSRSFLHFGCQNIHHNVAAVIITPAFKSGLYSSPSALSKKKPMLRTPRRAGSSVLHRTLTGNRIPGT